MPKPVYLMTVKEAYSLIDQIRAKFEQLDSGEFDYLKTELDNAKGSPQACILRALKSTFQIKITVF